MEILDFIKEECILRNQPLFNRKGGKFIWALDLRKSILNPSIMTQIANKFLDAYENTFPFQLAAVESSGIPMMASIQSEALKRGMHINGLIVRIKRKKHLQRSHIDGKPDGTRVILIDDSINSGSSLINAAVKLKDAGISVNNAFVIVDFTSNSGIKNLRNHKISLTSLFHIQDLGLNYPDTHIAITKYDTHWTFASPNPNLGFAVCKSTPVLYKDSIMFGSDSGTFWCLDSKTGRLKWWRITNDKTGKGIISSPCLVGDRVYFGSYTGELFCLNAENGNIIWSKKVCDWIGSSPCYANGMIYIGLEFGSKTEGGALGCFDADTGVLKWKHGFKIQLHGSPVYSESRNMIILGTNDGTMCTFEADSGKLLHELKNLKAVKYHAAIKDDLAVFGAFDGKAYVYNYVTGEVKFTYQTDDLLYMRPLIVDNRAFIGSSDDQLIVIDLETMTLVSTFDMKEKLHSSPALINGIVYFGTSKGELIGMDPFTLDIIVRLQFPERLTNQVVTNGDLLYVYAFDNKMWAIRHDSI